jgi:hypothetical protein
VFPLCASQNIDYTSRDPVLTDQCLNFEQESSKTKPISTIYLTSYWPGCRNICPTDRLHQISRTVAMASEHQAKLSLQDQRKARKGQEAKKAPPLRIKNLAQFLSSHEQRESWLDVCHQERMARYQQQSVCAFSELDDYFEGFYVQNNQILAHVSHVCGEAIRQHQLPKSYWGKTYAPHMPYSFWNSLEEGATVQHIEYMAPLYDTTDLTTMSKAELSQWNPFVNEVYIAQQNGPVYGIIPAARLEYRNSQISDHTFIPVSPVSPALKVLNPRIPISMVRSSASVMNISHLIHHPTPARNPAQEQLPPKDEGVHPASSMWPYDFGMWKSPEA